MRSYSLIAPAKINLYLEIIGDASGGLRQGPDGYHVVSYDTSKYRTCRPN